VTAPGLQPRLPSAPLSASQHTLAHVVAQTHTQCGTHTHVVLPRLLALQAALTADTRCLQVTAACSFTACFQCVQWAQGAESCVRSKACNTCGGIHLSSLALLCALPGPTRHVNIMLHPIANNMYAPHVPRQVILGQAVAEQEAVTETSLPYVL